MLRPPVSDKDHSQGSGSAPIVLVEYGDYQCPHCGRAYPILKKIQKQLGDDLRFVFRNFPIEESHPQAVQAAVASEAAALQNKYWQMHDALFEHQRDLSQDSILNLAKTIKLDIKQFTTDIRNENLFKKVESDFESGARSGVNGTPGFFVNGQHYYDNWDYEYFLNYLKGLLQLK
jgi:protein-disulfide isomerase